MFFKDLLAGIAGKLFFPQLDLQFENAVDCMKQHADLYVQIPPCAKRMYEGMAKLRRVNDTEKQTGKQKELRIAEDGLGDDRRMKVGRKMRRDTKQRRRKNLGKRDIEKRKSVKRICKKENALTRSTAEGVGGYMGHSREQHQDYLS